MEKVLYIQLNIYAAAICLLLFIHQRKNRQQVLGKKIFEMLTLSVMTVELLNVISWLLEGTVFPGAYVLYLTELHLHFGIQIIPSVYLYFYCIQAEDVWKNSAKKSKRVFKVLIGSWWTITIVNVFYPFLFYVDKHNIYHRLPALYLVTAVLLVLQLVEMCICITRKRKEKDNRIYNHLIGLFLISILGTLTQMVIYGVETAWLAVSIGLLYVYINVQSKREKAAIERWNEFKVLSLLSQMQPHFLYNSINTIEQYCEREPEKAKIAVDRFAVFLRGNLDSLMSRRPVFFTDEMDYVKAYLYLEKMRKEEKLAVEYDIEVEDFLLPVLTIQPLVENAVRYGIGSREKGGWIRISTRQKRDYVVVTVQDNGIGMDVERIEDIVPGNDERSHVGLINVKNRLEKMVQGILQIHSTREEGTTVTITIPMRSGE